MTRRDVLKKIRNGAIGTLIVLLLLVGAGVGYTWYMGMQQPVEAAEEEVVETQRPTQITPTQPAPDAPVGVSSQMLTSPVKPGENASLTVKTNAGATCEITVTYGKKEETEKRSQDSGLSKKTANPYGIVAWSWTVEADRPLGSWPVEVTCANEVNSGYLKLDLVVGTEEA